MRRGAYLRETRDAAEHLFSSPLFFFFFLFLPVISSARLAFGIRLLAVPNHWSTSRDPIFFLLITPLFGSGFSCVEPNGFSWIRQEWFDLVVHLHHILLGGRMQTFFPFFFGLLHIVISPRGYHIGVGG